MGSFQGLGKHDGVGDVTFRSSVAVDRFWNRKFLAPCRKI